MADVTAKAASGRPEEPIIIKYLDWPSVIRDAVVGMWKQSWEMCRDKLREINQNQRCAEVLENILVETRYGD